MVEACLTAAAHAGTLLEQRRDIDEGYEFDSGVELFGDSVPAITQRFPQAVDSTI